MRKYTDLSSRYIKNNKKRGVITSITIMLAMAIMISFSMIYNAQEKEEKKSIKAEVGYYDVSFNKLTKEQYDKLTKDDRIVATYPGKQEGALIPKNVPDEAATSYTSIKLTPEAYENVFKVDLIQGRLPEKENEIVVDSYAAANMGLNINIGTEIEFYLYEDAEHNTINRYGDDKDWSVEQRVLMSYDLDKAIASKKAVKYKVVGISRNMNKQYKILGYVDTKELYKSGDIDAYTTLKSTKKTGWGEYGYGDEKSIGDDLGIKFFLSEDPYGTGHLASQVRYIDYTSIDNSKGVTTGNATLIIIMVSIFMFAAIFNIFNISVYQRIREIGILRAIGGSTKQISKIVMREANLYAVVGIILGALAGYFLTKGIFIPVTSAMNVEISTEYLTISIGDVIQTALIVYVMVIWSASVGIRKQIKITPVEAMSTFSNNKENDISIVGKNKFIEGNRKIETKLAYKNLYRNTTRNNMCTLVISISMILFIFYISAFLSGLTTIETSLPSTNWDMEIEEPYTSQTYIPLNNDDISKIKKIDGVKDAYINSNMDIGIPIKKEIAGSLLSDVYASDKDFAEEREYNGYYGARANIRIVDRESIKLYDDYLVDGNIDYDKLNNDGILLVNSGSKRFVTSRTQAGDNVQFTNTDRLLEIDVNDELKLPSQSYPTTKNAMEKVLDGKGIEEDKFIPLKVQGILSDDAMMDNTNKYDSAQINSDFKIIITKECYEKYFGPRLEQSIYIKTDLDVNRDNIKDSLESISDKNHSSIKDYEEIKQAQEKKVKENLAIQIMFLVALVIIVVINLANTFYASIIMRKKEFAAIRAIGMAIRQMRKMIIFEILIIAMEASTFSVCIGGFLTLYKEMGMQKVGLGHLDYWAISLIGSVIFILVITLLSAIQSIRKVNGLSIVDDLRGEE